MPLESITRVSEDCLYGLWEITEQETELSLEWAEPTNSYFQSIRVEEKRREWLASRILVKRLVNELGEDFCGIEKDVHEKPHLIGSKSHISLSHTQGWAAAIIHQRKATGIDIEKKSEKVGRVVQKFLNQREREAVAGDLDEAMVYWCAKETLYKLNGKKGMHFKEQLLVTKEKGADLFEGAVLQKGTKRTVALNACRREELVLVHSR